MRGKAQTTSKQHQVRIIPRYEMKTKSQEGHQKTGLRNGWTNRQDFASKIGTQQAI